MGASEAGARTVRRPPTSARLVELLGVLEGEGEDLHACTSAHGAVIKLYLRGLPRGLDPEVVARAVAAVTPIGYPIRRLTRVAGAEYDEALLEGVRRHRASRGVAHVLDAMLTFSDLRPGLPARRSASARIVTVRDAASAAPRGSMRSSATQRARLCGAACADPRRGVRAPAKRVRTELS